MLAEIEIFHSRPIAPTRRIALGEYTLPLDSSPSVGSLLLGAVVARHIEAVDPDLLADLSRLSHQVESGHRIAQPRLRHRFQDDRVGLLRSRHRALVTGGALWFEHDDDKGLPVQQVLGAVYAVADFDPGVRRQMMAVVRRGLHWVGGDSTDRDAVARLVSFLSGDRGAYRLPGDAMGDPFSWALQVLEFAVIGETVDHPGATAVTKRFRSLLRHAHPDGGGETGEAADRIAKLAEARRILLS